MAIYNKQVFKVGPSTKANAQGQHWMVIETEGKEPGKPKVENIFDEKIRAKFSSGPGVYKLTYNKNDKGFWNITDAEFVSGIPGVTNGNGGTPAIGYFGPKAEVMAPQPVPVRVSIALSCIEAACKVSMPDPANEIPVLARLLMAEAETFITGTIDTQSSANKKPVVPEETPEGA